MISNKIDQYQDIMRECYLEDEELLTKWHINAKYGKESCIKRSIDEMENRNNLKFFTISNENEIVGFYGTEMDCFLSTFFVKPKYRKKEYMKEIWEIMTNSFQSTFHSALYSKNTKAIDFLKKNGGNIYSTIIHNENEPFVIIVFNKEQSWQ